MFVGQNGRLLSKMKPPFYQEVAWIRFMQQGPLQVKLISVSLLLAALEPGFEFLRLQDHQFTQ